MNARKRTRVENLCGCHAADGRIVYCASHEKVQAMATMLNACRYYFLDGEAGEDSPLVKKIDAIIPRP